MSPAWIRSPFSELVPSSLSLPLVARRAWEFTRWLRDICLPFQLPGPFAYGPHPPHTQLTWFVLTQPKPGQCSRLNQEAEYAQEGTLDFSSF